MIRNGLVILAGMALVAAGMNGTSLDPPTDFEPTRETDSPEADDLVAVAKNADDRNLLMFQSCNQCHRNIENEVDVHQVVEVTKGIDVADPESADASWITDVVRATDTAMVYVTRNDPHVSIHDNARIWLSAVTRAADQSSCAQCHAQSVVWTVHDGQQNLDVDGQLDLEVAPSSEAEPHEDHPADRYRSSRSSQRTDWTQTFLHSSALQYLAHAQHDDSAVTAFDVYLRHEQLEDEAAETFRVVEADPAIRSQLGLEERVGLVLDPVGPESPAAQAGLERFDVVTAIDMHPAIDGMADRLVALIAEPRPNDVSLELIRSGDRQRLVLEANVPLSEVSYWIGVRINEVPETLRAQLDGLDDRGAMVGEVLSDTPAERAGLQVHDIILTMSGQPITSPESLIAQVAATLGEPTELQIIRDGRSRTLAIDPEPRPEPEEQTASEPTSGTSYDLMTYILQDGSTFRALTEVEATADQTLLCPAVRGSNCPALIRIEETGAINFFASPGHPAATKIDSDEDVDQGIEESGVMNNPSAPESSSTTESRIRGLRDRLEQIHRELDQILEEGERP